jgi:uncharacterized protein
MYRTAFAGMSVWLAILLAIPVVHAAKLSGRQVTLAGHRFSVELATTDTEREHGLMKRKHMAAAHGMLFVYPDAQPRSFWMKDTLIPLDILFFDARRRLINVSADTPPCKTARCPTYASTAPARYVLELNAGTVKRLDIKIGERFKLD